MMRSISEDMSPSVVSEIDARLEGLARFHDVRIPLAIESGSRAWGFPSPDSDYDCRFLFVRHPDRYMSPWQRPDVIEMPPEGDFDVNGWDLGKAVKLMLKGNAVIIEWLQSPIVYSADRQLREEFLSLARRHADRNRIARHYLHLGERQWATYFHRGESAPIKKLFYVLRPAMALRWMQRHSDAALPPMNFVELSAACELAPDFAAFVDKLLAQKRITRELRASPVPHAVGAFVTSEFAAAREWLSGRAPRIADTAYREGEAFFISTVKRLAA